MSPEANHTTLPTVMEGLAIYIHHGTSELKGNTRNPPYYLACVWHTVVAYEMFEW